MGNADPVDDRTFNGNFSEEGAAKLKERVKDKLKEYMSGYTDDNLVEYVTVLIRNGRRKEEAENELKIFLGDHSDSFVAWLWDHLDECLDEYFSSPVEQTTVKSSLISSQNEDKVPTHMDSESEKGRSERLHGARRTRQWRSQPTNAVPPLLSSEVHKIYNYEDKDRKKRHDKRSPSPQSLSHRKRSRTDDSRNEQREAKPDVSRRLLQFAVRDALATSKPSNCSTKPSLKRLRSVVSASTQDSSDPDPDPSRKIRSVARVVNPMATVIKAVAEAAEDAKTPKSGRSVFDRISHSTGFSETMDHHMVDTEVSPENEDCRNFSEDHEPVQHQYSHSLGNNGVYVENTTTFDTGLQPSYSSDRNRINNPKAFDTGLQPSGNVSHPSNFLRNRINNPKALQHRLTDEPIRVEWTNYQNHLTEVATEHKTACFSGNVDTGKTVTLEEKMKVPDVGLQRSMDRGRLVSSEVITQSSMVKTSTDTIGNGNIKPAANAKKDSTIKISVPGTLSTIRPMEDATSRTIFVANVHFGATKDSLSRHFNKFGEVLKAVIVTDPATGLPSGSAYIEFTRREAADNALSLDGTSFMSRILKIVKGSNNGQQQEAATSMTWARAGRFTRASSLRGVGAFRGRSVIRGGARSMQWKRDSTTETGNNIVAPTPRSLTYVRTESKPDGTARA